MNYKLYVLSGILLAWQTPGLLLAQQPAAAQVRWSLPLPANVSKAHVDAAGKTWLLSGANTFQVVDTDGQVRWTKTVSAITVADFAVDSAGRLFLLGLPPTGQPIIEKYDADQALLWRHVLDSLSANPTHASQLNLALAGSGSCLALGINATNGQRVSYYFVRANGSLGVHTGVEALSTGRSWPIQLLRPIVYNRQHVLFGIEQPTQPNTPPAFFGAELTPTILYQRPVITATLAAYRALADRRTGRVPDRSFQRTLPLLTDGSAAYALTQVDTVASATTTAGSTLMKLENGYDQLQLTYPAADSLSLRQLAQSSTRWLDNRGSLVALRLVPGSTATTTDLLLEQYAMPGLQQIATQRIGTADARAQQLTMLKRDADGTLVLMGRTASTLTIGKQTFSGTSDAPVSFLIALSPGLPARMLAPEQVRWAVTLPGTARPISSDTQGRTWMQGADSTLGHYNADGKLVWRLRLLSTNAQDFGTDAAGNLYILGDSTVRKYDGGGAHQWTYRFYGRTNEMLRNGKLAIKPGGGGVWIKGDFFTGASQVDMAEFDKAGRELMYQTLYAGDTNRYVCTPGYVQAMSDNRIVYGLYLRGGQRGTDLQANRMGFYAAKQVRDGFGTGRALWMQATATEVLVLSQELSQPASVIGPAEYNRYAFTRFDSTGNRIVSEQNTIAVNALRVATSWGVTPVGTLYSLQISPHTETSKRSTHRLLLTEHNPNLSPRQTVVLGTFTQALGRPSTCDLVQAYADGSLLLSGLATGTLAVGDSLIMGSAAVPVRFLVRVGTAASPQEAPGSLADAQAEVPTPQARQGSQTEIAEVDIKVYPNPVSEQLTVRWAGADANAQLRLLDGQGRVVREGQLANGLGELNVQGLPGGTFLLQLLANQQPRWVRKVVVQ